MSRTIKLILLPIIVLWVIVIITGYYWGHQYVLIPPVVGIIRSLIVLVISLLFFAAALGYGGLLLRILTVSFDSRAQSLIFSTALGLCLMSLIALALGLLGFLNQAIFWILTLAGTGAAIISIWRENQQSPFSLKIKFKGLRGIDYFFVAFIAITVLLGLQLALAPPIGWDGLTTHLVFIDDLLGAGKLEPLPVVPGRITGHLLFAWGMALGGDTMPQLISYELGILLILSVFVFTRANFGLRTSVLAAAVLVSVEVFILNAGWPYLDVPVTFFSWLAVIALLYWQRSQSTSRSWLLLATILAVFAGHTKLNGLFVYPVMVIGYLLGLYWNKAQLRKRLIDGAAALLAAAALILIWSFAEGLLISESTALAGLIPPQADSAVNRLPTLNTLGVKLEDYVKVIWEMTVIGQQGAVIYDGTISPLFLLLIPVLFVLKDKPKLIVFLMVAGLVEFTSWLLFPRDYYQNRHLIIAYPIFSVLAAYVIYRLDEFDFEWFSLSGFFRLLLILVFSLQLFSTLVWWQSVKPLSYLLGLQSRDDFLGENLGGGTSPGYYDMMKAIEEKVPDGSVVGMLWPEPRLYYCPGECIRFPFGRLRTAEEMLVEASTLGLTHVLVSQNGLNYWLEFYEDKPAKLEDRQEYQKAVKDLIGEHGRLVHNQDDSYFLYSLSLDGKDD